MGLGAGLLLIRLSPVEALVLFGLGALVIGTLAEPLVGLVGGLFLGLLRAYLQAEVPQVPAQIGHLFVLLAVASWAARGLLRRDLRLPPSRGVLLPLMGFIGAAWLSLWNAVDLGYGLPEFAKWIEVLLALWVVADRATPRRLPWLVAGIFLVGLFQAGVGLYQFGLRGEGPEHFLIAGTDFYRAYGTFEQPNPYAGYIGMTLALALGVFLGQWGERDKGTGRPPFVLLALCPLLPLAAALLASWSRGAWLGFAAAMGAIAFAWPRRARWGVLVAAVLVVGALALHLAGLVPPALISRLTDFAADLRLQDVRGVGINDANYAVVERLAHWQSALEMWRSHFWTGVGLGCYEPAYPRFALINWPNALGHAHNIYLNLLAETGILGLVAYLAFWGAVFWQTWRATRTTVGLPRGLALGLLGAWTHLSVHHFFDNLYVNNAHLLVGLLLGLLITRSPSHPVIQSPSNPVTE
ncbi:MAG TPA: O-antigen ligase domain-containing protein [Chloroflexi bacterium]|nr:O-antigen ligase domain-containing protein [Chloroflexota bacterium]